jgi:hypothetical protein
VHRLTKTQARRIAVRAQVLDAPRPTDLLDVVRRLTAARSTRPRRSRPARILRGHVLPKRRFQIRRVDVVLCTRRGEPTLFEVDHAVDRHVLADDELAVDSDDRLLTLCSALGSPQRR